MRKNCSEHISLRVTVGQVAKRSGVAISTLHYYEAEGLISKVAFLGLGAMGSRMAANLLKAGHAVTAWNRSPAAAEALVASGAKKLPLRRRRLSVPTSFSR